MRSRVTILGLFCIVNLASVWAQVSTSGVGPQIKTLPEHVVYRTLFRKIASFRHYADEQEKQGKSASSLRYLVQRHVGLTSDQTATMDRILEEYEQRAAEKDKEAHLIIDAYRAQYPFGIVPHGTQKAPIPPQLKILQAQRDAITLDAVNRLRNELGPDAFGRIDAHARRTLRQVATVPSSR